MSIINLNTEKEIKKQNSKEMNDLFITETEEMINEGKYNLVKLINSIPDGEKIEKLAKELKADITTLEEKIEKFLAQHHSDYIITFNEFIDTVKKDMKLKIEQMENYEKERRKINNVNIILCERDFFRQESIRLNESNKEFSKKNEELQHQLKFQITENNLIRKKWMETEKMLKKLSSELELNLKNQRENFKKSKEEENFINSNNFNNIQFPYLNGNFQFNKFSLKCDDNFNTNINTNHCLEKLKNDLKKEKMKNQKILTEFNKLIEDKNSLEKLFIDCVEECRRDINQRKLKESLMKNKINNLKVYQTSNGFYRNNLRDKGDISEKKLESFHLSDKRKLFEIFILKDEIINLIKNQIFSQNLEKIEETVEMPPSINKNLIDANPFKQKVRASSNSQKNKPSYRAKTANVI